MKYSTRFTYYYRKNINHLPKWMVIASVNEEVYY